MDYDEATVGETVDRVPLGRFHWLLVGLLGAVWAATSITVLGISFVLPIFIDIWGLSGFTAGVLGSASLLGMLVGNSIGGRYADVAGRKRTLVVSVTGFSVFSGLMGLSVGLYSAVTFRFLTGIGLGATVVSGASYLSEHLPSESRGRYVTYLEVLFTLGSLATVILAWLLLSALPVDGRLFGVAAWRVFFGFGIAPIALAALVAIYLPKSPYYLAEKGRTDEALSRIESMARYNDIDVSGFPTRLRRSRSQSAGFSRLFEADLRGTTILVMGLWFGVNLAYYGIFTWLPDTIGTVGFADDLYLYLFVVAVFQMLGQLAGAYLIEVVGRRWTLGGLLLAGGLSTLLFAVAIPTGGGGSEVLFAVGLFAMSFSLLGAWAVLYAYTSEIFPTEVRSTGLGVTGSVGKIAATAGPVFFGTLAQFGYVAALAPVSTILVAVGLALVAFGEETRGETLV
jgi:putative MFS transporter